jgi:hypothetical protein
MAEDAPIYGRGMLAGEDVRGYVPGGLLAGQQAQPPGGYVWNSVDALSRIPGDVVRLRDRLAEAPLETAGGLLASMPGGRLGAEGMPLLAALGGALRGVRAYHGGPGSNPYHPSGGGSITEWRAAPDNPAYFAERPGTASNYALERYPERAAVYPVRLDTANAFVHDQASGFLSNAELIRRAREQGRDMVVIRNAYDQPGRFAGSRAAQPETIYIALDGSRIFPAFGSGQ